MRSGTIVSLTFAAPFVMLELFVSVALGQPAPPAPPGAAVVRALPAENDLDEDDQELFAERDGNEDGVLSGREVRGLEKFDADGDGEVTKEEFLQGRDALRENLDEIRAAAEQGFAALDKNEDGRLSGNEMNAVAAFDTNGDRRVTKDEFISGTLSQWRNRRAAVGGDLDLRVLHAAIRNQDADLILNRCDPELVERIDRPVLTMMLVAIYQLLGEIDAFPDDTVRRQPNENDATRVDYSGTFTFERGSAKVLLQVGKGKIIGLNIDSDKLAVVNKWFYELIAKDQTTARALAEFYRPRCVGLIQRVLGGQHDEVFDAFHPLVQQQLEKDKVTAFLAGVREQFGEFKDAELETQRVETNAQGEDGELSYSYIVRAKESDFRATVTFQFVGLKAGFTKFSVKRLDDEPAPPSKPMPAPAPSPEGEPEDADDWIAVRIEEEPLVVLAPLKLTRRVDKDGSIAFSGRTPDNKFGFEARLHTFEQDIASSAKEIFDNLETTLPEKLAGELLDSDEAKFKDHPGRLFAVRISEGRVYVNRCVLLGKKMVQLQVVFRDDETEETRAIVNRFVESLRDLPDGTEAPTDDDAPAPPPRPTRGQKNSVAPSDDDPPPPPMAPPSPPRIAPPTREKAPPAPRTPPPAPPPAPAPPAPQEAAPVEAPPAPPSGGF